MITECVGLFFWRESTRQSSIVEVEAAQQSSDAKTDRVGTFLKKSCYCYCWLFYCVGTKECATNTGEGEGSSLYQKGANNLRMASLGRGNGFVAKRRRLRAEEAMRSGGQRKELVQTGLLRLRKTVDRNGDDEELRVTRGSVWVVFGKSTSLLMTQALPVGCERENLWIKWKTLKKKQKTKKNVIDTLFD